MGMSYKQELDILYRAYTKSESGLWNLTKRLRETYPGNYTVVECYVPDKFCWGAKLVFEDKQEEIMFMLKWA